MGEKQSRDYEEVRAALAWERERMEKREEEFARQKRELEEQLRQAHQQQGLARRSVRRLGEFLTRAARTLR